MRTHSRAVFLGQVWGHVRSLKNINIARRRTYTQTAMPMPSTATCIYQRCITLPGPQTNSELLNLVLCVLMVCVVHSSFSRWLLFGSYIKAVFCGWIRSVLLPILRGIGFGAKHCQSRSTRTSHQQHDNSLTDCAVTDWHYEHVYTLVFLYD